MGAELDHTIVLCRDQRRSAAFLADILGRPAPLRFGPFHVIELDNGVSLDFYDGGGEVLSQHYAFLIGEADFDRAYARIVELGVRHWADPGRTQPGQISRHGGGRRVYFEDPDGHVLEVLTRP